MDFRLRIEPRTFNAANEQGKKQMIFATLLRSFDLLKDKFDKSRPKLDSKIFEDLEKLKAEVLSIGAEEHWI